MAPKKIAFDIDIVLDAALDVVRRKGLEGLTARAVAARLRSSVAPVYRAFRSMGDLERGVLEQSRRLLDEMTRREFTTIPFLNIGVGIVVFAREESRLFRALFLSRHRGRDILEGFQESVLDRMRTDAALRRLPESQLRRLLMSIWMYTLGLATAVVYGHLPGIAQEDLVRGLKDVGNALMFAEVSGIADSESPENDREWERQIREKGLVFPSREACKPGRSPKSDKEES